MMTQQTFDPAGKRPVIFFDWDGTLADSMNLCFAEVKAALEQIGLPPKSDRELAACNGPTYQESVAVLNIPPDKVEAYLSSRQKAEMALVPSVQKLFGGIPDMLRELSQRADLVIVSNGLTEYLALSMDVTGTRNCFVRAQGCMPGKNKTQVLALLLEQMKPTTCVMVGDRRGDILAGRDNGIPTIAACYGYGLPDEWAEADQQAYSVAQLRDQLMALAGVQH